MSRVQAEEDDSLSQFSLRKLSKIIRAPAEKELRLTVSEAAIYAELYAWSRRSAQSHWVLGEAEG